MGGCGDSSTGDGGTADATPPDGAVMDGSAPDGSRMDASPPDGAAMDAAMLDGSVVDANLPDASVMDSSAMDSGAMCNVAAITRIPRSSEPVMVGTLCDEVYACADDLADVARIEGASSRFDCTMGPEPGSGCGAYTCSYRNPSGPSTLDADELAEICKVTILVPTPAMRCVVFL